MIATPLAGCISSDSTGASLKQTGSSTVLPLAQAWAETYPDAQVSVSGGGSSHGINALLTGTADIGDASRKIGTGDYEKVECSVTADEIEAAQTGEHPWAYPSCNGVTPTEWVVAYDVLTVVVNPSNDWVDGLNYTQLQAIFTTANTAEHWDEVPGLEDAPHEQIEIFAPDEASGTYEFFFEEVAGEADESLLAAGSQRYHGNSNDNQILTAIETQEYAIGFFGFSYYVENKQRVHGVPLASEGTDHVQPSFETVDEYPITRPLHLYTDGVPQAGLPLHGYLSFALGEAGQSIAPQIGYVTIGDVSANTATAQLSTLS